MSTTTKINYAKETKALLKDSINRLGGELTNLSTFRSYASVLNAIYNALPKVSGTGSNISLSPTLKGGLDITPKGNCEQDTTAYIDVGTWEQGEIGSSSGNNVSSDSYVRTSNYILVVPNVLYNITRTISTGAMGFRFYDSNKNYLGTQATEGMVTTNQNDNRMSAGVSSMEMTINNTNVAYIRMVDGSNDLSTQYTISTTAPTPSYPQDIRVVTGDNDVVVTPKNLLNASAESYNITTTASTHTPIGTLQMVAGTTYYISYTIENSVTSLRNTPEIYLGGNNYQERAVENHNYTTGRKYWEFTPTISGTAELKYWTNNISDTLTISDFMISTSSDTTYSPYQAPQSTTLHLGTEYLAGIGDYKDTIVGKKDNWKIVRNVGKVVLDGSEDETWSIYNSGNYSTNPYFTTNTNGIVNIISTKIEIYCNRLMAQNITANTKCAIQTSSNNSILIQPSNNITSVENWKIYLNDNNIIAYIPLSTPTQTPITDTTLIHDLNNMYDLMGYDGTTNITITSNSANAQMTAQVSALKGE